MASVRSLYSNMEKMGRCSVSHVRIVASMPFGYDGPFAKTMSATNIILVLGVRGRATPYNTNQYLSFKCLSPDPFECGSRPAKFH